MDHAGYNLKKNNIKSKNRLYLVCKQQGTNKKYNYTNSADQLTWHFSFCLSCFLVYED